MKKIYYFSGTGNTLYLAKYFKEKLGYELEEIKLGEKLKLTGEIGLMFPIYAMGIPRIVEEFIKGVDVQDVEYLFIVATCGLDSYGISLYQINRLLKGKKVDYIDYCHMPDNYIKIFVPLSKEEAERDIEQSKSKMELISEELSGKKRKIKRVPFMKKLSYWGLYRFWRLGLSVSYSKFKLDKKRCVSCEICKKVCPVENIEMVNGNPSWKKRCEDCLACVNLCPTRAISCGGKSKLEKRYRNPYIDIKELMRRG